MKRRNERTESIVLLNVVDFYSIFTRIIDYNTTKKVLDTLKEEFEGNIKAKPIKLLVLKRDFGRITVRSPTTTIGRSLTS